MEERGEITAKGTYTLSPRIAQKLLELSFKTGQSRSYLVRRALDLYFSTKDEPSKNPNAA